MDVRIAASLNTRNNLKGEIGICVAKEKWKAKGFPLMDDDDSYIPLPSGQVN